MLPKQFRLCLLSCILLFSFSACTTVHSSKTQSKERKSEIYLQMGVRYLEMDKLKIAKENLDIAEDMDSKNPKTHNALAVLHERLKQYDIARQHFLRAIELDPEEHSYLNNYGRFLCDRGDYEQGVQYLNQALSKPLNNKRWLAYTNLGGCELRMGEQQKAELDFRKALQLNPRFSPALLEMQKISYRQGKYMSARAFLERYLAVARHTAGSLWFGVQTERAMGNKKLAEQYRDTLFTLFPVSKEAQQLKKANQPR